MENRKYLRINFRSVIINIDTFVFPKTAPFRTKWILFFDQSMFFGKLQVYLIAIFL